MSVRSDIAAYLAAQGLGTVATDIFYSLLPDSPDLCTAIFEYAGRPGEYGGGTGAATIEYPRFQVVTRGLTDNAAESRIQAVYAALELVSMETIGGGFYHAIRALGRPAMHPSGRDENNRYRCLCNFEATKGP